LFAALNVATGKVSGRQYKRRRRIEFLDFMNRIVAEHSGREIHFILENLKTHKPNNDRWLNRHTTVHFHFTPTKTSWLNQVEIWFSSPAAKALSGTSFNDRKQFDAPYRRFHHRL
jgi:transposase